MRTYTIGGVVETHTPEKFEATASFIRHDEHKSTFLSGIAITIYNPRMIETSEVEQLNALDYFSKMFATMNGVETSLFPDLREYPIIVYTAKPIDNVHAI